MKYRKKPVVVEAFKYDLNLSASKYPVWFYKAILDGIVEIKGHDKGFVYCLIKTLEGEIVANFGDYIIKGVAGELYPCKADIFEQTYELVEE